MACTIDHLSADHQVRVIRRFHDSRGVVHEAGETGVIRRIELDFPAGEIVIQWEREGTAESMRFRLDAREGPRNGGMKEYFEVIEYAPAPRPPRPKPQPPDTPAGRIWSLAAASRFDEAKARLLELLKEPNPGGSCEQALWLSGELGAAAETHAFDPDGKVYEWLKDNCIHLLYHWGSGATSGGEGTARRREMDVVERRFAELDRQRAAQGL